MGLHCPTSVHGPQPLWGCHSFHSRLTSRSLALLQPWRADRETAEYLGSCSHQPSPRSRRRPWPSPGPQPLLFDAGATNLQQPWPSMSRSSTTSQPAMPMSSRCSRMRSWRCVGQREGLPRGAGLHNPGTWHVCPTLFPRTLPLGSNARPQLPHPQSLAEGPSSLGDLRGHTGRGS